jgi:CBS domain-containing protein
MQWTRFWPWKRRPRDRAARRVKDVMTRDVEAIHADASLEEAARKMSMLDVGPLPVHDGEVLVGMLTDRDITVRAVAMGLDPIQARARDAMTPEVVSCFEDQDVQEAANLMQERKIRRLLVLDRNRRLVGIVSLGDLALETSDEKRVGEILETISEPDDR